MTALELYKFVNDNDIEWHWSNNGDKLDVIIFVNFYNIDDFHKILSDSIFDDEGIICHMKDGYFCFWMNDICEYFGIYLNEVFEKEKENG